MSEEDLSKQIESLQRRVAELETTLNASEVEAEVLRASEGRYRQAVEESSNAIIVIDPAGTILSWNTASTELTGYPVNEAIGMDCSSLILEPEPSYFSSAVLSRVFQGDRLSGLELDFRCSDGSVRRMISRAYPVRDRQDNVVECILANTEVTLLTRTEESLLEEQVRLDNLVRQRSADLASVNEQLTEEIEERKRTEGELRQSAERLALALDGANVGIWDWDLTTGKAFWTGRIHRILGYEPNEVESDLKNWKRLIHPDDWPKVSEKLNLHLDGKEPLFEIEQRMLNKSGEWVWVQGRGKVVEFSPDGKPIRMTGVIVDISDRRKAEDALRESEELYRELVENIEDIVCKHDLLGNFLFVSRKSAQLLGYLPSEMIGTNLARYLAPEVRDQFESYLAAIRRDGRASGLMLVETRSGERRLWEYCNNIRTKNGGAQIVIGLARDVTERKRAEKELLQAEQRYRRLFEDAPLMYVITRSEGGVPYISDCNQLFLRKIGFARNDVVGKLLGDFYSPESRRALLDGGGYAKALAGRFFIGERQLLTRDGKLIPTLLYTTPEEDADGRVVGTRAMFVDITDRVKVQEALRESEARYRTVVEESFDGVFVQQGTVITFANSRLHELLGYEPGELVGLEHWLIYHPDYQAITRSRAQARLGGELVPSRYEVKLLRKDGTAFPGEINARVILFDGEPGIQVWIRDLTEQKLLERRLVEAQKMESIGTLTGGIAHDFNNLLTIINGFAEMILLEASEDDPKYSELQKILETGRKGAEMVQRLLAFSKKAGISPQPLDLSNFVKNSVSLMRRTFPKMIEIETALGTDLGMVNADTGQLEQALMNLCINAKEAMPEGGRIRIETGNALLDQEYCRLHHGCKPGRFVLIKISDTGTGMSQETIERMFDPFFTTKGWDFNKGTGLGLSVAKGIVEQHGGWIACDSDHGKGTTFRLYLPTIEDSSAVSEPIPQGEEVLETDKILLVDDEELLRDLAKRILERSGYTVITASDGKEALEIYAREQSNIALVVLDLIMPQMSGWQCLEGLLKINPHIKTIVSTGYSLAQSERDRLGTLAKGYVSKPYQVKQLVQAVKQVLETPG